MEKQRLASALPDHVCVFHANGQWMVSRMGIDPPCKTLKVYAKYTGNPHLLFEDPASIQAFLDDEDPELEVLQTFVRRTRRHRNTVVLTVREMRRYAGLDAKLSRKGPGTWVESLGAATYVPHRGSGMEAISNFRPMGAWSWRAIVEHDYAAYYFEKALVNAEALLQARLRSKPHVGRVEPKASRSAAEWQATWYDLGVPPHFCIDQVRAQVTFRTMAVDVLAASCQ